MPSTVELSREVVQNAIHESVDLTSCAEILGVTENLHVLDRVIRTSGFDLSAWEVLSDPKALKRFNELYANSPSKTRRFTLTHLLKFDREILPTLFEKGVRSGSFVGRYLTSYNKFYLWLTEECECGITSEWRGKPIRLQLHHKNGDNSDNQLVNLCYLCPNCHSQTVNFGGRNLQAFRIV